MPICHVFTNLKEEYLGSDFSVKLSQCLADMLNKPIARISVLVHCGLQMCRGGTNDPTVAIQIWSIGVFDKERNPKYTDTLFAHLRPRLNYIPAERIVIAYHPINAEDVGMMANWS